MVPGAFGHGDPAPQRQPRARPYLSLEPGGKLQASPVGIARRSPRLQDQRPVGRRRQIQPGRARGHVRAAAPPPGAAS